MPPRPADVSPRIYVFHGDVSWGFNGHILESYYDYYGDNQTYLNYFSWDILAKLWERNTPL
jgi:hypothetical protein